MLGVGLVLAKLRKRLWSTTRALKVARDLRGLAADDRGGDLVFEAVAPGATLPLTALLEQKDGGDVLFVRAMERTRRARAGELVVARSPQGEVVAAHFVHRREDHARLASVARGLYPEPTAPEVLTEAVYVAPSWRGRSVARAMLAETCRRLAAEGKLSATAFIDVTNHASLRAFSQAGYSPASLMRLDRYVAGIRRSRFVAADRIALDEWTSATAGSPGSSARRRNEA